jgi:hypothetical protein
MKNSLLTKFENVFSDLRALLTSEKQPSPKKPEPKIDEPKRPRKNAPQQASVKKKMGKSEEFVRSKNKSLKDSQGTPKFSGSGYNGQGAPDHGKIRSNRKRR